MRQAIAPTLLIAALLLTACGRQAPAAPQRLTAVVQAHATTPAHRAAPARTVVKGGFVDLDGNSVSLDSYAGKPVVLAFLSPTDGDSQAEVPLLLRLAGGYAADGVTIIAAGESSSVDALRGFQASAGITFPLWQDATGSELKARGFHGVPAFEFIGRNGSVAGSHEGFASRGELTAGIEGIVGR
jgi:thiol-disulfide isomerase/thioredoxin